MKKDIQRQLKDERDEQIEVRSKYHALDFLVAATQILTVMCIIKGNPAWKGSLSTLFFGGAAAVKAERKPVHFSLDGCRPFRYFCRVSIHNIGST